MCSTLVPSWSSLGQCAPLPFLSPVTDVVHSIYPNVPMGVAWNGNNIGGSTKRAVGIAMHVGEWFYFLILNVPWFSFAQASVILVALSLDSHSGPPMLLVSSEGMASWLAWSPWASSSVSLCISTSCAKTLAGMQTWRGWASHSSLTLRIRDTKNAKRVTTPR